MPLIGTKAAASSQGFGQFAESGAEAVYVEDVFSTYLYTGNGSTQTITNGIDLAGEGGLVWTKNRSNTAAHVLVDTQRVNPTGEAKSLYSNLTSAEWAESGISFSSTGFLLGTPFYRASTNTNGNTYASWTFRKQPKFFDVVTVTGQATQTTFNHNLGSVPGCIIIKCTNSTGDWFVYHRSTGSSQYLVLNSTSAQAAYTNWCVATSTTVTVLGGVMGNANSFVVYLFAHDAGGFGLSGTDNVISCGSFTTDGSGNATVTLGYEPQWVLFKPSGITASWVVVDSMRGMDATGYDSRLFPNFSVVEDTGFGGIAPTATGFNGTGLGGRGLGNNLAYIYIAIRRGPMKVPTSGTEVYNAIARTGTGAVANVTGLGFTPDLAISKGRDASLLPWDWQDRLRGATRYIKSNDTAAEAVDANSLTAFNMNGVTLGADASVGQWNYLDEPYIQSFFKRAPGFFDEVCYTGDGVTTGRAINHNLGAAPELIVVKSRNSSGNWATRCSYITSPNSYVLNLNNATAASIKGNYFQGTPTQTTFTVGYDATVNNPGTGYVAYLFATVAGVSKVGSYTGTGTTQVINCGFTAGARFVLIKRTDSTGDWYVWDSARGIVSGNDPYLLLNSTAAEVTSTDYVDTASTGFEISSTAPAAINANGGKFIFLAIA